MSLYENFMKVLCQRKEDMIRPIVARVKEMQALEYHPEQVITALAKEGHNLDIIEAAVDFVFKGALNNEVPPHSYEDVKNIVQASLLSTHPKEIVAALTAKTQFGSIIPVSEAEELNLENYIAYCQASRNSALLNELHETLSPYISNMIINLSMASRDDSRVCTASSAREADTLDKWLELFGIWSPETQKAFNKSAVSASGNIILAEQYEDGEYTYCQKYRTEINIEHVCKDCPFYSEQRTASTDDVIRRCRFRR